MWDHLLGLWGGWAESPFSEDTANRGRVQRTGRNGLGVLGSLMVILTSSYLSAITSPESSQARPSFWGEPENIPQRLDSLTKVLALF